MNLQDKLLAATRMAAEAYNKGSTPTDAVTKAAQDYNFNKDQTDRLVEMFNTALTLHNFSKHADDRTGEFDLASKEDVTKAIYAEPKKAEAKKMYDYSCYDQPETRNFKIASMEKAAAAIEKEPVMPEELDPEYLAHKGMHYVQVCKQAADAAKEAEDQVRSHMITELYKLAEFVRQGYEPEERYLKVKCAAKQYPKILENLDRVLPERFTKLAEKYDEDDLMDFSDIEEALDKLKDLQGMMDDVNSLHIQSITFKKKAEDMWKSISGPYFEAKEEGIFDKIVKRAQVATPFDVTKAMVPVVPMQEDLPSWSDTKAKKDQADIEDLKATDDNLTRQEILTDLVSTDPIISEADPADVARAYQTLVALAPRVSLQKEVVRAMLRQSINSVALSPFDAKAYVDLNNAMGGKVTQKA